MLLCETDMPKRTVNALAKKKIITEKDLCEFFPAKYYDYRNIKDIKNCKLEHHSAVKGRLIKAEKKLGKQSFYYSMSICQPDNTYFRVVIFSDALIRESKATDYCKNTNIVVCGKISFDTIFGYSITNPDIICKEEAFKPQIKTTYPKIRGVSDKTLREIIEKSINVQKEPLEPEILPKGYMGYKDALKAMHFPTSGEEYAAGKKRILFNDLLYFAMALKISAGVERKDSPVLLSKTELTHSFINTLPFTLTEDQNNAVNKILSDAGMGKRNNVLLQGDVGCGKTIVAVCLMMAAAENGYQSVLMAPRSVLAAQHYNEIKEYAKNMGITCVFLASDMKAKEKKEALHLIESGDAQFIIGTHSVIAQNVSYNNLGVVITDEEHLFGVSQKEMLAEKAREGVHYISMSATPIPRSLATVLYGEQKEICIIRSKPAGRKPIKTCIQWEHQNTFEFMEKEIMNGHQCYVVCPAIEDNPEIDLVSIESVEREYRSYFEPKGIKIGVLNGKMNKEEVDTEINSFSNNEKQILISTTVIEVGVNVPNTTVMVIEQAERFGLASLHQLRGRVGRNSYQSYCILISKEINNARLKAMCDTNDGFEIAEADLKQRGTGNLIGTQQAGMNRLVNAMLENEREFAYCQKLAQDFLQKGMGNGLLDIYRED